jgi:hypothetical protein
MERAMNSDAMGRAKGRFAGQNPEPLFEVDV